MGKVTVKRSLFCLPWTQTILGTQLGDRANFMALDWLTRVNFSPPMMGICVNKQHASHEAILKTGEFSVNVPSVEMVEATDYTGLVSGKKIDKSTLFEIFYGTLKKAPMIRDCPLAIECKVAQAVELPSNSFFIGEMITIYSEEKYLTDEKPDYEKIKPFMLTMPDNTYWALGSPIGKAWDAGKKMKEELGKKDPGTS